MMHISTRSSQAHPWWGLVLALITAAPGCGGCANTAPEVKLPPEQNAAPQRSAEPLERTPEEPCKEGDPCARSLPADAAYPDRFLHTATALGDGTTLIIGGYTWDGHRRGALSGTLALNVRLQTRERPSSYPRWGHTATLLPDGSVLVIGGSMDDPELSPFRQAPPERFDVAAGWRELLPPWEARFRHTATLMPDDSVLVVGGASSYEKSLNSIERYAPKTNTWEKIGTMDKVRYDHTATLLGDGSILVVGGRQGAGCGEDCAIDCIEDIDCGQGGVCADEFFCARPLGDVGLFDPTTRVWTTLPELSEPRYDHTATLLTDGSVLIAGGRGSIGALASAVVFDAKTRVWTTPKAMSTARSGHTATLMPDGSVWIVGGRSPITQGALCADGNPCPEDQLHQALTSVERFSIASRTWRTQTPLQRARYDHTTTLTASGVLMVWGGAQGKRLAVKGGERHDPGSNGWTLVGDRF